MKNKLLKNLIFPLFMLCGSFIYAQTVSGVVSDATGPLPGVNILVKGTTNGTQTDFDGNYTLNNVNSGDVIVFSFLGYATQEITYTGQATLNVTLEEDAATLDEVVVIGYGTTTVKDATGAVEAVTSEEFNSGVIATPEQLIQGKTAGVQISETSGEPGSSVNIRIRGTTSVTSDNNPLFVIDGVAIGAGGPPEGANVGFGTSAAKNPLAFLNPNDIESISILKDASATAIYGSRGANGVVIITTKSGKSGRGGLWEFSSSLSMSETLNRYDLLERAEFLSAVTQFGGDAQAQNFGAGTDWQNVVLRNTTSQNQNLSYSRNYGNGNVRATFGYGKQFGVVEKSDFERISGRINANHRFLDDKLQVNFQGTLSRINDQSPPLSGSAGFRGDLLGAAYSANPTWPNSVSFNPGGQLNPANMLAYTLNRSNTNRYLLNLSASYDFTDELSAKVNIGYDNSDIERGAVASARAINLDRNVFGNGRGAYNEVELENRTLELTVSYNKEFENSRLELLGGYAFQDFQTSGRNVEGFGFGTTDLNAMIAGLENTADRIENTLSGRYQQYGYAPNVNGIFVNRLFPDIQTDFVSSVTGATTSLFADTFDNTDELQSFFARAIYTLNDKYILTATVRADGSSKFGENNRYGYFPSAAFAWKINEEDFIGDSVSTLKLRLNYGITGNETGLGYGSAIERIRYAGGGIDDGGNINIPGATTVSLDNKDLQWEETTQYGIGIDFGFNNDRLSGSIDVYRKETENLLFNIIPAQPAPNPFEFGNLDGVVINQGVEFNIAYDFVQSEDLNIGANFNIAYNDNEFQDFAGLIPAGTIRGQGLSQAFAQMVAGGQPLFSFFVRDFQGFDNNGQPIGDVQQFVDKSALPDITSGFTLTANYKNWDLSAFFNGQFGNYIYNNTANAFFTAGAIANARNVTPDVLTSGEAGNAEAAVSTRFLEKGDFVRFQNLTIGYNLPVKADGFFKSFRITATGQNLALWTDYSGLDPEISVAPGGGDLLNGIPILGIDYTSYPRPRIYTLGVNVTF